ncbi:DUF1015 family protein [Jatrophihabitans sp. YIM 134969]
MTDAAAPRPPASAGLSLAPFRARRYTDTAHLAQLLSPPYDVIDDAERAALVAGNADNVVTVILPRTDDGSDPYSGAADTLAGWSAEDDGPVMAVDAEPALYVYEMSTGEATTRGVVGAVTLHDPSDGVILPHENVMAGPVADRLALMEATDANLEPIYLVYPGGGATSDLVAAVDRTDSSARELANVTTPDGVTHRLWAVTDPEAHAAVAADLSQHTAVIADGHHRYATYRELQARRTAEHGAGPWDRGLTLLVDTSTYGAQVEAIHRVIPGVDLGEAVRRLERESDGPDLTVTPVDDALAALHEIEQRPDSATGAAVVLTDAGGAVVVEGLRSPTEELGSDLDVVAVHRDLIERRLGVADTVETVRYAHDVDEAVQLAAETGGVAVLLRPTPVEAVMAVARAGGRMPRKSTLFVPKPASGLVIRRFADEQPES